MPKEKKKSKKRENAAFLENARALREGKRMRDREKLADHVELIERRIGVIKEAFYDVGRALKEIRDDELYQHADPPAEDFEAFLRTHGWFGKTYAYQLIDIATYYERDTAIGLETTAMAHEIIEYAKRKHGRPEEAQRIAARGEIEGHPIKELTAEEVAQLTRKKKKSKKAGDAAQLEARREARLWDEWLADMGIPGAVARAVEDDGEWIVQASVPVAVLAKFRARRRT